MTVMDRQGIVRWLRESDEAGLAVPYTGLILTAREPPELRRQVMALGVSQIDAGKSSPLNAMTRQVFDRTDVGIIVAEAGRWNEFEEIILRGLRGGGVLVVFNKSDVAHVEPAVAEKLEASQAGWVEGDLPASAGAEVRAALTPPSASL